MEKWSRLFTSCVNENLMSYSVCPCDFSIAHDIKIIVEDKLIRRNLKLKKTNAAQVSS